MPRRSRGLGVVAIVVAVIVGLGVSCNGFREDEIECEKASVQLHDCCPGFVLSHLDCTYHESLDCNDSVVAREYPALSMVDSECLRKKSCDKIASDGDCARAQAAKQRVVAEDAAATPKTAEVRICKD